MTSAGDSGTTVRPRSNWDGQDERLVLPLFDEEYLLTLFSQRQEDNPQPGTKIDAVSKVSCLATLRQQPYPIFQNCFAFFSLAFPVEDLLYYQLLNSTAQRLLFFSSAMRYPLLPFPCRCSGIIHIIYRR